jgi:cation diffusion facilitator CzcD-associated flavoprotein CzcO
VEIGDYFIDVARKYEIYPFISFQSRVVAARWDEEAAKWFIDIEDSSSGSASVATVEADVFVNCGGILNDWKWPDIEGLDAFKGPRVHTATWVS